MIDYEEEFIYLKAEKEVLETENKKLHQKIKELSEANVRNEELLKESSDTIKYLHNTISDDLVYIAHIEEENEYMAKSLVVRSIEERKLDEDKNPTGYRILKCREIYDTFKKNGYPETIESYKCWEYVVESPYKYQAIWNSEWASRHILKAEKNLPSLLGLMYAQNKNIILNDTTKCINDYMYDERLEINTHSGYWIITFKSLHQLDISNVTKYFCFK